MRKQLAVILVAAMALASCNNVEVVDGVKIQKHEHDDSAAKLKEGDIITFDLVIKNDADSTIKDSRKEGKPLQDLVPPAAPAGAFKGSFENGLRLLSVGDSATIFVPVDSLFKDANQPVPPFLKRGTDVRFIVKIKKSQSRAEFEKEMAKLSAEQTGKDAKLIEAYVANSGKKFTKTSTGLYASISNPGVGEGPKMGESWEVNYIGTFLDGKEFDKGAGVAMPPVGQLVPGFNEALMLLKKGGKGTFVIPSALGYGAQGAAPRIPANAILVFELEVLSKK
ncbi:MAG: FKBP-type peptidyl-prolyl cis-trans isomerase [Cytophagales bacterium]|nr:FKBP-type peptidyl-prolyl cis-trans isomerase [Cytophagales bacterium]